MIHCALLTRSFTAKISMMETVDGLCFATIVHICYTSGVLIARKYIFCLLNEVSMKYEEAIKELLKQCNGLVTSSQITNAGIPRRCLSKMVYEKKLVRAARGVYATPEAWEDELYILQYRYSKGIFSHDTALDIHGLTDRMSTGYVMTFPAGYNTSALKDTVVNAKTCVKKLYNLGIVEKSTDCDNIVKVYDVERTLCDIVRGNKSFDIQLVNEAMKAYVRSGRRDIQKLMLYAESLHVKSKIQVYMEVLL